MKVISIISAKTLLKILAVVAVCMVLFNLFKWFLYIAITMMIGLFKSVFVFSLLVIMALIVLVNLNSGRKCRRAQKNRSDRPNNNVIAEEKYV